MKIYLHAREGIVPIYLYKTLLMTKLIICLIFIFSIRTFATPSIAQEKVSIRLERTDLKNVIKSIEKQTKVRFIYIDNLLNNTVANVHATNQPWTHVLLPLLSNAGLSIKKLDDQRMVIQPLKNKQEGYPVTGLVVDISGKPLTGVSIIEKSSERGTSTDETGRFSLNASNDQATIVISFIGYLTQEVPVSSQEIRVVLEEDLTSLEEIVVVGFGTQKKANLTGAVSSVDMDKVLGDRPVSSASQALQGALPGMQVTFGSGRPGQSTNLNIRGETSINGGAPLVLVDNVPMNIDDVNPKDIQNVTVLKDAAASSIYGARAAFGVILITTKKAGRNQPTRFNYSTNLTWSTPTTLPEKASPLEFVQGLKDFGNTTNWAGQNVETWLGLLEEYQADPSLYPDGITTVGGTRYPLQEHDMYGAVFTTGKEQLHNLSFSGGSERIAYRLSGMYADEDGIMLTNKDRYKRYNLNAYVNTELFKNFNASANILYKNDNRTTPMNMGEMFYRAITHSSYVNPGYDIAPDGTSIPYGTPNNYLKYEDPTKNYNDDLRLFGKLEYNPLRGLNITAEYTFNKNNTNRQYYQVRHTYMNPNNYTEEHLFNNEYYERTSGITNYNALNLYANYEHSLSDHNFKYLLGTNYEKSHTESYWATRYDLLSPTSPSLGTSTGNQLVGDSFGQYAVLGYFGRINYDYKSRYLLEINGRLDGSSRFQEGSRFGFFPSISAGWNISEEPFMANLRNTVPLLKFRGSFGEIGNQVVRNPDGTEVYFPVTPEMTATNTNWINPETNIRYLAINPPNLVSSTFTWEAVRTLNVGVDIGLFNSKLNTSFDWFRRQTIGMLFRGADLPAVLGAEPPFQNVTDLASKGWEWELSWRDKISEFSYSIGFNLSDNKGIITRINNSAGLIDGYYLNKEIGEIWGYVTDGFYTVDDFVEGTLDNNLMNGQLKDGIPYFNGVAQNPGDVKYQDLNNDGIIFSGNGTLSDPGDMRVIGNNRRRYQFGINTDFSYKNFDLSVFLQGVGKRDMWMSNALIWPYSNEFGTLFKHSLDYWTPENPEAYYGRIYANAGLNTGANRRVQTRFLQDGSYLRVRNITLGYNLSKDLLKTKFLERVRLYVTGENLFLFDKLPAGIEADAENLGSGGIYPYLKKYSFGVNINF
ncbi:SusC/RagA family TonB-linked outer membrane protein [Sphingobacterium chuzhouense]|uniref:TonB-dependent receptor n=1 Tax=Sphingobacterium chuzhouense TaxID=1742264 RepID=A0ABR7XNP9_9SPHI|nr:TonB-dependent receptor [Sphingobacterium chuzhouense]MBD1420768.1 TonB-dependent receptor [Sphingobacterium chuzhouense]